MFVKKAIRVIAGKDKGTEVVVLTALQTNIVGGVNTNTNVQLTDHREGRSSTYQTCSLTKMV